MQTLPEVRVSGCPHPFRAERVDSVSHAGATLRSAIEQGFKGLDVPLALTNYGHAFVNERYVPRDKWDEIILKEGDFVTYRIVPQGGGGGGKSPLRVILSIAVIAVAAWAAWATTGWLAAQGGIWATTVNGVTQASWAASMVGGLAGGVVTAVGGFLANAIAPVRASSLSSYSNQTESEIYSISGAKNSLKPFDAVPVLLGRHIIVPPQGAKPYTELAGSDQFVRQLFVWGYGRIKLTDMKIGDTPISSFTDVEIETVEGTADDPDLTLYTQDVNEDALSVELTAEAGWQLRTTGEGVDRISVDLAFPRGLTQFDNNGNRTPHTVNVEAQYRLVGTEAWKGLVGQADYPARSFTLLPSFITEYQDWGPSTVPTSRWHTVCVSINGAMELRSGVEGETLAPSVPSGYVGVCEVRVVGESIDRVDDIRPDDVTGLTATYSGLGLNIAAGQLALDTFNVTAAQTTTLRRNVNLVVPNGQYEIRLRRVTADTDSTQIVDGVYWAALRTFTNRKPINFPKPLAMTAIRIKATGQLNGALDDFNAVGELYVQDWDATTQAWVERPSSNPASLIRWVLQGPANARPAADAQIDLENLKYFHEFCTTHGFTYNKYHDGAMSVFEVLSDIAAAGRASISRRDGKWGVVIDEPKDIVVQMFTPRNSWGFKALKALPRTPHAWRVRFVNEQQAWAQDERIVYEDGYDESNATEFEGLELPGVTNPDHVWKIGRHHLAVARLRPEDYELYVDMEHIVCTRGDLVRVAHDTPLWGSEQARIKAVSGKNITLDEPFFMEAGKRYCLRVRTAEGESLYSEVVSAPGWSKTLTSNVELAAEKGDLAAFGELGQETVELLVKGIEPADNFSARLVLCDYSPAIFNAAAGTVPPFETHITSPTRFSVVKPPRVFFGNVRSDETVLLRGMDGTLQSRICVVFTSAGGEDLSKCLVQAYYRQEGTEDWLLGGTANATDGTVFISPVEDGRAYDLRLRTVNEKSVASDWTTLGGAHTVVGKTTPPPNIAVLLRDDNLATWSYPSPPADFAGFKARWMSGVHAGTEWTFASPAHEGLLTSNSFDLSLLPVGEITLMVKALDVVGIESLTAARLTVDVGGPVLENVILTYDDKAAGFPGTKTGCSLSGGDLVADMTSLFWTDRFYPASETTPFWEPEYAAMTYLFSYTPGAEEVGLSLSLEYAHTGTLLAVEYNVSGQSPFWGGLDGDLFWSEAVFWPDPGIPTWLPLPAKLSPLAYAEYRFRVTLAGGVQQGSLTKLLAHVDVPDIREDLADVMVSSGGTRLPVTKSYRGIKQVVLTVQEDGGSAISAKVVDKSVSGPLVVGLDSTGAQVGALVDATVIGY